MGTLATLPKNTYTAFQHKRVTRVTRLNMIERLTLETCRQLKGKGYNQENSGCHFCGTNSDRPEEFKIVEGYRYDWLVDAFSGEVIARPNLEEIVEALGSTFASLKRTSHLRWLAYHSLLRMDLPSCVIAETPTEALAKLYILLMTNKETK